MDIGPVEVIDEQLLTSLGVSVVDREVFEQDFLHRLEEQYKENELSETRTTQETEEKEEGELDVDTSSKEEIVNETSEGSSLISTEPNAELVETNSGKEKITNKSDGSGSSGSMLKSLLLARSKPEDETASEKQVRTGQMTPFGNVLPKSGPKKDSFMDYTRYLQTQLTLNKEFQEKRKLDAKKKVKVQSNSNSDEVSDEGRISQVRLKKKTKNHSSRKRTSALDMDVLFPKKRAKKPVVGTSTSSNPRDSKKLPGKSQAETTGMYLNESEGSDYRPPTDSDYSGDDNRKGSTSQSTVTGGKKRKLAKNYKEVNTSDSEDSDIERPETKRRKITDDGDRKAYQLRVQKWKENEFRFTGEMQELEGGFKIPVHLWESLYDYQKVGVKWLWELHQQSGGGILGDEMGLGKTIQVIAFLAGLKCTDLLFRFSKYRGLGPSLIVCPATVMHQWVREFHTWWPPLRIAILHESGSFSGTKLNLIRNIQEYAGILVTTYAGLVNNHAEIMKHEWHYVIVDEGHKIRNPDAKLTLALKQIGTPHRLILSGSPLQNNLKELWSLFDFIYPGKLGTLPTFMEQFAVPITQGGYANASDLQVAAAFKCATALRSIISPYLLRRMKSDVSAHLDLPPKNEQVLFCKLTEEQRRVYLGYLGSDDVRSIMKGSLEVFAGLVYLRKICNHPDLFTGGPKLLVPNKNRIPMSKTNTVSKVNLDYLVEDEGEDIEMSGDGDFGHWKKSGKMIVVRTLLKLWKEQGHKVLLFTQSRQMLCIIESFVRSEKYTYLRMDGGTSIGSRQPMIEKFNEDESMFVFLLTTRVGGLGVNLTGANRVIIFDPDWNPSTDLQARERAWRIGQSRQVTIYRLITSGTIEEKIYHRQIFKQFLTNRILKNPKQKRFFKSNDLMELFTLNEGDQNENSKTESEAIFAGTGSKIKIPKRQNPRERKSGKFRSVPHLVKQTLLSNSETTEEGMDVDSNTSKSHVNQDDYVLRKLFKKSGVESALRHDKILDSNDSDYLLVEKEAERVAKDAVAALKLSRQQCWGADSGRPTWTGQSGFVRQIPNSVKPKPKPLPPPPKPIQEPEADPLETSFFSKPRLQDSNEDISGTDLLSIIRARNRELLEPKASTSATAAASSEETEEPEASTADPIFPVSDKDIDLLTEIRSFIAFRAKSDGQASTDELLQEFKAKLPPKESPIFKQMLRQLCTSRQVEGRRIWRLKPEFR